jgi:hypothetical protein
VTVYLAHVGEALPGDPDDVAGPWLELRPAGAGLLLVDSDDSLSRVYHALKWSLEEDAPLLVAALGTLPKLRGSPPGTTTWLRDRLPPA